MGKGGRSTRREKRKGEGRVMRKSFSRLVQLAGVGWRARCSESCTAGSGKGGGKRVLGDNALAAYFTPKSIQRAFREKIKETAGRGRACLHIWKDLCIVTVIKRTQKKHVVEVTRRLTLGKEQQANDLLNQSQGGSVWNTAFIERLNGSATSTYLLTLSEATNKEVCW